MPWRKRTQIFLTAGIPEEAQAKHGSDVVAHLDEAILSFVRAAHAAEVQIVCRADPDILPLMALAALDLADPPSVEKYEMFHEGSPFLRVFSADNTDAFAAYDPHAFDPSFFSFEKIPRDLQTSASTRQIYRQTEPIALVCMGESARMMSDFESFLEYHESGPVFTFSRTGGISRILHTLQNASRRVRPFDEEFKTPSTSSHEENSIEVIPYAYLCEKLLQNLLLDRTSDSAI